MADPKEQKIWNFKMIIEQIYFLIILTLIGSQSKSFQVEQTVH